MRKISGWMVALVTLALAACGGDKAFVSGSSTSSSSGSASAAASLVVITDTPTVYSDGSNSATITAYVRDASNQFVSGVPVQFSADSGGLTVTQSVTDSNGVATATLDAAGDPSSRVITVTATAGTLMSEAQVSVTGSTLNLQGGNAITVGQVVTYTVTLHDYGNHAISGKTVTITASSNFVTLSSSTVTTDATGVATFTVTGNSATTGTVTATALGLSGQQSVTVSGGTNLTFTAPAANAEVDIGTAQTVTAHYVEGGVAVSGRTINFSTTRGTLSAASATTDASGNATVTISSTNAGGATITATESTSNSSASVSIEFIATTPAALDLQPSLFTISPGATSTLTAIVRDAAGNLVKNQTIVFGLADVTGGTLSVGSAVTDSQGKAQTVYTAGSVTSANNGVTVTATVQGLPAVTDSVSLTVAGQQLFISMGTGNTVDTSLNSAQFKLVYVVQVTDSTGAGVANVSLNMTVLSQQYWKGYYTEDASKNWSQTITAGPCADEDVNHNGVLDPGEDFNGDGLIEAGNVATVTPSTAVTDSSGFALVSVIYPRDHSGWVRVGLTALTSVSGTEFARSTSFVLPGQASDYKGTDTPPPGNISPYGVATSCSNPN